MSTPSVVRPGPDRHRTVTGLIDEYRSFAELIGALDRFRTGPVKPAAQAGRCATSPATWWGRRSTRSAAAIGSRTPDEQAAALRVEDPGALAARLHTAMDSMARLVTVFDDATWSAPSPVPGLTLGQGVHTLLNDAYVHGDDIRAALGLPFDGGPGLQASLDFVLGALLRDDAVAADPDVARLLGVPAEDFTRQTGMAAHDFVLAATGRCDPAGLGLPDGVNIFR